MEEDPQGLWGASKATRGTRGPVLAIEGRKDSLHAAEGDYRNSMGKRRERPWNRPTLLKCEEEKVP